MHNPTLFSFLKSHFAPAFFFLPAERRRALQQLYAVFRLLDDIVDNQPAEKARADIKQWRQFLSSKDPSLLISLGHEKMGGDLLAVMKKYDIPEFSINDFISKGLDVDLEKNRFETPLDTESYCYGVAGTVGVACLPIFGVPWQEAKDYAVRLGIGVQWINILRDVATDARLGRIYLPQDHLEKFGCKEADVLAGRFNAEFQELIRYEAEVARSHYRRANELLPTAWSDALKPARLMGEIYMKLLAKIEKHHYAVLEKRIQLNFFEKAATAWVALRS